MYKDRTGLLLVLLLVVGWGCEKEEKREDSVPKTKSKHLSAEEAAEGQKIWANLLSKEEKKHQLPTTIKQAITSFQGYSTCLHQIQKRLPPDLSTAMLAYHNLPDALCRTREAISKQSKSICDRVITFSMRKGCKIMYAMYHKQAAACPLGYKGRKGRHGYCIALAERNTSLCATSRTDDQEARCRAILTGKESECDNLTKHDKREACKIEVERWRGLVTETRATLPSGFIPSLELSLSMTGGTVPQQYQKVQPSCARLGAVVPSFGNSEQVNFCDYYSYVYRRSHTYRSNSYRTYAKVNFSFRPPKSSTDVVKFGTDAFFGIKIVRLGDYRNHPTGEIKFTHFERKRGGRLAGTFKVTVSGLNGNLTVEGKFDSVIRDLVDPAKISKGYHRHPNRGLLGRKNTYGLGLVGRRNSPIGATGLYGKRRTKRFAALLTGATLKRTIVRHRTGFELTAIVPNSIWEHLSLRNKDILFQVEAIKLRNKSDIIRLRSELRTAKSLTLYLQRHNRSKKIIVGLPTLERIRQEFYF